MTDNNLSLDSDDDFCSGQKVSHHYWQQSFSGLHTPGWSNYTIISLVCQKKKYKILKWMRDMAERVFKVAVTEQWNM